MAADACARGHEGDTCESDEHAEDFAEGGVLEAKEDGEDEGVDR